MATLTVYPDAGTGGTTIDGAVYRFGVDEFWGTLRAGAGNFNENSGNPIQGVFMQCSTTSNQFQQLARFIMTFDTSALTAGATISAATLSLNGTAKADNFSCDPDINIYTSTPASNNALVDADYGQTGTVAQCDTTITYANYSTSGFNDFAFNATGLGNISKTSISKFSVKSARNDAGAVSPATEGHWTSEQSAGFTFNSADNAGTSSDPKLVITYTLPAGPANLKSYNTNLKANIKTINTNPIANVKSLDTNV